MGCGASTHASTKIALTLEEDLAQNRQRVQEYEERWDWEMRDYEGRVLREEETHHDLEECLAQLQYNLNATESEASTELTQARRSLALAQEETETVIQRALAGLRRQEEDAHATINNLRQRLFVIDQELTVSSESARVSVLRRLADEENIFKVSRSEAAATKRESRDETEHVARLKASSEILAAEVRNVQDEGGRWRSFEEEEAMVVSRLSAEASTYRLEKLNLETLLNKRQGAASVKLLANARSKLAEQLIRVERLRLGDSESAVSSGGTRRSLGHVLTESHALINQVSDLVEQRRQQSYEPVALYPKQRGFVASSCLVKGGGSGRIVEMAGAFRDFTPRLLLERLGEPWAPAILDCSIEAKEPVPSTEGDCIAANGGVHCDRSFQSEPLEVAIETTPDEFCEAAHATQQDPLESSGVEVIGVPRGPSIGDLPLVIHNEDTPESSPDFVLSQSDCTKEQTDTGLDEKPDLDVLGVLASERNCTEISANMGSDGVLECDGSQVLGASSIGGNGEEVHTDASYTNNLETTGMHVVEAACVEPSCIAAREEGASDRFLCSTVVDAEVPPIDRDHTRELGEDGSEPGFQKPLMCEIGSPTLEGDDEPLVEGVVLVSSGVSQSAPADAVEAPPMGGEEEPEDAGWDDSD